MFTQTKHPFINSTSYTKEVKFFFNSYGTTQTEGVPTQCDEKNIWTKEAGTEGWIESKSNEKLHDVSARREMKKLCRTKITKEKFKHFNCRIQA